MALDIGSGLMAENLELYVSSIYFLSQWPHAATGNRTRVREISCAFSIEQQTGRFTH